MAPCGGGRLQPFPYALAWWPRFFHVCSSDHKPRCRCAAPCRPQLRQAEANEEKERGNALFGRKKYEEAAKAFTRCIELDPRWLG
jgi:hypothetical protein